VITAAPPAPPAAQRGQESAAVFVSAAEIWRRWRMPLAIIVVVLIGGTVIALLKPAPPASGYLDPAGNGPLGAHALADIRAGRGQAGRHSSSPARSS